MSTEEDGDLFGWGETKVESHSRADEMFEKFKQFHKENPHIWEMFNKFTCQLLAAGHQHHSARAVIERIRWETSLRTTDEQFKIPNNHIPYYARMFNARTPFNDKFFKCNKRVSEEYTLKHRDKPPEIIEADEKKEAGMMKELAELK